MIDNLEDNISKNKDTNREQQRQIDVLLETHSTINNGFWDNTLLWINESEWANRNIVDKLSDIVIKNIDDITQNKETLDDLHENVKELERCAIESKNNIEDINTQLEENSEEQAVQDEKITQIGSHFCCFADGIWGDWFLWHNDDIWINEPNKHESRISELETSFMNILNILTAQQKQLSEQQEELNKQKNMLETIMLCLSVISVGAWNNELLWYNEAIWSNGSYFDDDAKERLTVKSYNEYGQEITLETVSHYYNENNQSLGFNNVEHSYQNSSETIDFK